mgnify:CR=1 FL=1
MRTVFFFLLVCLTAKTERLWGQLPDSAVWDVPARWMEVDRLHNVYLIDDNNGVRKWTPQGPSPFLYTNQELGTLQQFDATDPFNLLLYYPDFMTAVQLDRTLNERSRLSFPELGLPQVDGIAKSRDNQIWAYDGLGYRLLKLNAQGEILAESQNLSLLPQGAPSRVEQLFAAGNYVYLYDAERGVLLFDASGQYMRTVDLPGMRAIQTLGNRLVLRDHHNLIVVVGTGQQETVTLPASIPATAVVRLTRSHILYLHQQQLHIQQRNQ